MINGRRLFLLRVLLLILGSVCCLKPLQCVAVVLEPRLLKCIQMCVSLGHTVQGNDPDDTWTVWRPCIRKMYGSD